VKLRKLKIERIARIEVEHIDVRIPMEGYKAGGILEPLL
jgi:hypothetical protein